MVLFRFIIRIGRILFLGIVILLVLYSLLGFIVVPLVGKRLLVSKISETTGHNLQIESVSFNPFTFVTTIKGAHLKGENQKDLLVGFERLELYFQLRSLWGPELTVNEINLVKPMVNLVLQANGQWNIADLFKKREKAKLPQKSLKSTKSEKASKKLLPPLFIKKVLLSHGQVNVADLRCFSSFNESILDLNILVNQIRPQTGQTSYIEIDAQTSNGILGKRLEVKGSATLSPLKFNGQLKLHEVKLAQRWELFKKQVQFKIQGGTANLSTSFLFSVSNGKSQFKITKGNADVQGLKLEKAGDMTSPIVLPVVKLSNISYDLLKNHLRFQQIVVKNAKIEAVLSQKKRLNLKALFVKEKGVKKKDRKKTAKNSKKRSKPFKLHIDQITFSDSQVVLINHTHQPPSELHFQHLNAKVKNFSSHSNQVSTFSMGGKVAQHSSFNIIGQSTVLNFKQKTAFELTLNNFSLPAINPYFKKMLGQVIEKGNLDAHLQYKIKNGQMVGENRIVIDQMTLGEESDVEGAMDLPLGILVGVLQDGEGKIDIDLPVRGDLKEPDFKYGNLVAKSLWNVVKKAATSPFRFFADLFGSDEKKISIRSDKKN